MSTRKPVVAILDDSPTVLKALARLLRSHGYSVETYASAEEYLEVAKTSGCVLLIVDMQLGHISGLDVVRRLRLLEKNIPFIAISGSGNDLIRQSALELGAAAYFEKPLSMDLLNEVRKIVGLPSA